MAFAKVSKPKPDPYITITTRTEGGNAIMLPAHTRDLIGDPVAVFFEWDPDDSLLRIVASSPADPDSYRVGVRNRIGVKGLLGSLGVEVDKTGPHPVIADGPLAVIADLSNYRRAA